MKTSYLLLLLSLDPITGILACPACTLQQPRLLRGITHGVGPDSRWDYLIVSVAVAIVLGSLYFSIKWLIRPGERSETHIKQVILTFD
ncbi:MAG TPA: hypothetical protein VGQ51_00305 [Puia sp.]|nr:hypothetical protein [Puia sp.]